MKKKKLVFGLIVFFFLLLLVFLYLNQSRSILIKNKNLSFLAEDSVELNSQGRSPLSGWPCFNYQRRPLAVVLANDPVARPLSGLSQADLVIEMPVITGSITRLLAFYVCYSPPEVGSLRSARHDFIPLAIGFDAVLAHWGGSHYALDQLRAGVMDNLDALPNPYQAFYQKKNIPQPHNGFSSIDRLWQSAQKMGYRSENRFEGYSFKKGQALIEQKGLLKIGYAYPYDLKYVYNPLSNKYRRYRTGQLERDKNNGQPIEAANLIVMRVVSRQIEGPFYNDLDLEGSGPCQLYQNGLVFKCRWQKSEANPQSKLVFLDEDNEEISLVVGQTWIEMVEPYQAVTWQVLGKED